MFDAWHRINSSWQVTTYHTSKNPMKSHQVYSQVIYVVPPKKLRETLKHDCLAMRLKAGWKYFLNHFSSYSTLTLHWHTVSQHSWLYIEHRPIVIWHRLKVNGRFTCLWNPQKKQRQIVKKVIASRNFNTNCLKCQMKAVTLSIPAWGSWADCVQLGN